MKNNKIIKKTFVNFDKEEEWLNQMSKDGYGLLNYNCGIYIFRPIEPNYYQYAIELLNTRNKFEKEHYLSFLEEMGIEVVSTYGGRAYLCKVNDGTDFAIYSDIDSRIKQYQKGHAIWATVSCSQFASASVLIFAALKYTSPKTPEFYIALTFSLLLLLSSILLVTIFGKPYRNKIKLLKQEKKIME